MDIELRSLREEDARISYKWRNDPDIWKFTRFNFTGLTTLKDELEWIQRVINMKSDYRFAIIADRKYVGNIYLVCKLEGIAEFHIFIGDKNMWGKGIASKATDILIFFARNELHLKKIQLEVHVDNDKAKIMYKNKGFIKLQDIGDNFEKMELHL